ncbi:unnamed protein product [Trichobilharzia regenti]|nr:unnamed protein product [Trichobilharzia regenti]
MEGNKTKCINSAAHNTTTTTGHIDNSNNNNNYNYYVDSSYIHGYDNTVSNNLDNAQKNISNENGIMPYEMSNNHNNNNNDNNNHCGDQDFLVISSSTTTDGNNHIRVENADDPNCHRTEQHLLETDFLAYTNECLMHTSWLDNFPGEQEHPTTDFQQNINHQYFTNHLYNFSSDSYNAGQQSLLQPSSSSSSSIVCGRNDIWFDQKEFTCLPDETLKTEVYSREQERLSSSSSSPPSSSSFTLLLSDRSVLSTPPPITVNLQNIYEMNYELLVNSDKLSHRTF